MSVRVETSGGDEIIKRLGRLSGKINESVGKALVISASMIETDAKNNVRENRSIATGNLFQSIGTVVIDNDPDEIALFVGTAVQYAKNVEFGMAVGSDEDFESHDFYLRILEWVKVKGIAGGDPSEQSRAAFFITQHIRAHGTQPHPFLIPAYESNLSKIKVLIEKAIKEAASVS